jgi:hypothetical protein
MVFSKVCLGIQQIIGALFEAAVDKYVPIEKFDFVYGGARSSEKVP